MSFTLIAWQPGAGLPLPKDVDEAQAQLERAMAQPAESPQPVFAHFVRALLARFPDDAGDDGAVYDASPEPDSTAQHCVVGLWTGAEVFDAAYAHVVVQANDRGLHVMDEQNGLVFLANGQALALGEPQHGLRAYDALQRGDAAAAWAEYRRLAPLRDPQSLRDWGFLICNGTGCRRHMALGAAVAQLSGKDPAADPELARCLSQVPESRRARQAQLLAGLQKATDLVAFVDAELARDAAAPATATSATADKATVEAAQALGLPAEWVRRAAAGDGVAQGRLGHALLWHKGTATRTQAQLAAQWLEKAAAQGQATAQAMLGGALLMGYREMPIDMARGLALLEQAAAADNPLGLRYLSDHLHAKSVRAGRQAGTQVQLNDPESVRKQARVLELCTRWAAGGDAMGVFKLAVRLHDGVGAPADRVAAKAVMQVVKNPALGLSGAQVEEIRREETVALAMFEPTPEEARAVDELARELAADLRRLPEVLARRRAAAQAASVAAAPRRAPLPRPEPEEAPSSEADRLWHLGHLGLLLGAIGFLLLMVLAPSLGKVGFRLMAAAVGAAGAYGVWRSSGDLEWAPAKRVLLSLLALVPMVGFIVCVAVGLRVIRRS